MTIELGGPADPIGGRGVMFPLYAGSRYIFLDADARLLIIDLISQTDVVDIDINGLAATMRACRSACGTGHERRARCSARHAIARPQDKAPFPSGPVMPAMPRLASV